MHIESQLFSLSVLLTHPKFGPLRDVGPWQVWSSPWEGRSVVLHLFPSCATTSLARAMHIKQAWNLSNLTGFTSVFHEISTIYIFCFFKKDQPETEFLLRLFAHPLSPSFPLTVLHISAFNQRDNGQVLICIWSAGESAHLNKCFLNKLVYLQTSCICIL